MLHLIKPFGPLLFPQLVVVLAIAVLVVISVVRLTLGRGGVRAKASIDAILFWGAVAALLGLLGQLAGLLKLLGTVARHSDQLGVSPRMVAVGLSECLLTTTFGLLVLLGAGLLWKLLGFWWRQQAAGATS